jgi:hypothetical protein
MRALDHSAESPKSSGSEYQKKYQTGHTLREIVFAPALEHSNESNQEETDGTHSNTLDEHKDSRGKDRPVWREQERKTIT